MKDNESIEQLKGDFLGIAFEIRTSINAIYGLSDLLKQQQVDKPLSEEQVAYINHIQDNSYKLMTLITELLESNFLSIKLYDDTDKEMNNLIHKIQMNHDNKLSRFQVIEEAIKIGLKVLASDSAVQKTQEN